MRRYLKGTDIRQEYKALPRGHYVNCRQKFYTINDDHLIVYNNHKTGRACIVLPPQHAMAYMAYTHGNLFFGGHGGKDALCAEIRRHYYWPNYELDVKDFIKRCDCRYAKDIPRLQRGELKLFTPKRVNECVAIDHIGTLPITPDGYRYITTYYDRFSGFSKSVPVKEIDAFHTAINFILH